MRRTQAGFTLMEVMVTMAIVLIIMAGTMKAMSDAMRANETAQLTTSMNRGLRTAADIMVRDLLQVGQGLPDGHVIQIPEGGTASAIKLPAPPNVANSTPRLYDSTATEITAVIPGPGVGPTINGTPTDMITTLAVDSAIDGLVLTALTATSMTGNSLTVSGNGPDVIRPGDLMMILKGTTSSLVEVTTVTTPHTINFVANDPLNLNQAGGDTGTISALIAADPANDLTQVSVSRIRMISYYIDNVTEPTRPRLVRRLNNAGLRADNTLAYDNTKGTAVAFDVEGLQFSYDLVDGVNNWANVKMNSDDLAGSGRCSPVACNPNQIRKVNLTLSGRSRKTLQSTKQYLRNTLTTQISLRSLSFVDRYQ